MINLLQQRVPAPELAGLFAGHPVRPLIPPMDDAAWRSVAANPVAAPWCEAIRQRAWAERNQPMPELTDALYADYARTGQRLPFEKSYFERRRRLARATLAAVLETDPARKQAVLASANAAMVEVFAETSWALPAHVKTADGKDPAVIDLFAAETANLFGMLLQLLGDRLPPARRAAIKARLQSQFFERYFTGQFGWFDSENNWNAVCHQGVLGAALAVVDDPAMLSRLFAAAAPRLRTFINGFTDDGGTSEGPAYWMYGFGWFCELNRQLELRTGGELSLIEGDAKIAEIARFGPRMMLSNGSAINFADGSPRSTIRPALLTYLADRLADADIAAAADDAWRAARAEPFSLDALRDDLFNLSPHLLAAPRETSEASSPPDTDTLLPDLAVVISKFRDGADHYWEFAAKAGHNNEHHNHNDVGSYLLNIDGERVLIEIGMPEYTAAFFGPERYSFLAARSLGHPVPRINGHEQPAGPAFKGNLLQNRFTASDGLIEIDLTAAYPAAAGCQRAIRRFEIDKVRGVLSITDTIEMSPADNAEVAIIVAAPVRLESRDALIETDHVRARITPTNGCQIAGVESHDYRDHEHGLPMSINRIVLKPVKMGSQITIGSRLAIDESPAAR